MLPSKRKNITQFIYCSWSLEKCQVIGGAEPCDSLDCFCPRCWILFAGIPIPLVFRVSVGLAWCDLYIHGKTLTWTGFNRILQSLGQRSCIIKLWTSESQRQLQHNYINVFTLLHMVRIYVCQRSVSSLYALVTEILRVNFHSSYLFFFLCLGLLSVEQ